MKNLRPVRRKSRADGLIKWALIGAGVLLSVLLLAVPLVAIFAKAFSAGLLPVWRNLADGEMLHAIWLTVLIALICVPVNLVFGVLLAWLVARFRFVGRQLLLSLTDIPFAVSPVVAGLLFLLCYGAGGWPGSWLSERGVALMFAWPGMVLVTVFVTCPFVVRELVPVMLSQGSDQDEAAVLLGASGLKMFWRVTLPNIRHALLYGVVLTCARAIGEFGAVSVVSGSVRGETMTLPLQIELLDQDYNTVGAFSAAALLALMAMLTLFIQAVLQNKRQGSRGDLTAVKVPIARRMVNYARRRVLRQLAGKREGDYQAHQERSL